MSGANVSAPEEVDVAIIGGGPGGLATAAALLSACGKDCNVKVRQNSHIDVIPQRRWTLASWDVRIRIHTAGHRSVQLPASWCT